MCCLFRCLLSSQHYVSCRYRDWTARMYLRSRVIWRQRGRRIQRSSCAQLSWHSSYSSRVFTAPGEWALFKDKFSFYLIFFRLDVGIYLKESDSLVIFAFTNNYMCKLFLFFFFFLIKGSWFYCGVSFRGGLTPHQCLFWNDAFS